MRISDWSSDVCSSDLGDMTTLSVYTTADTDEQQVLQFAHEFRVGGDGMRLGGSYTHAWTRPDLAGLPIKSTTQIVSLFASYPVTLTQAHQLTVGGGLDVIDQAIGLGGIPPNRHRPRRLPLPPDAGWLGRGRAALR